MVLLLMSFSNEDTREDTPISYFIEEIVTDTDNKFNLEEMMDKLNHNDEFNDEFNAHIINYEENFTVKDLLLICEYYGFLNNVKNKKYTKNIIIEILVSFELDTNNADIVNKRLNAWFFMSELKNDKFMKKFVIW
jgi:hypothetical protein